MTDSMVFQQWPVAVQHARLKDFPSSSVYSDRWHDIKADDWFKFGVQIGDKTILDQDDGKKPMFHGTTAYAAERMVMGGGFVVGTGTHRKNNRSCSGAWVVSSFGEAFIHAG